MLIFPDKIKICLISDTHEEFRWREHPLGSYYNLLPEEFTFDVMVAAGDIDSGINGALTLIKKYCVTPIIYVAGNHEFYQSSKEELLPQFRTLAEEYDNFIFLEDGQHFHYEGVDFYGGTNWPKIPEPLQAEIKYNIADYSRIKNHHVTDVSLKDTFDENLRNAINDSDTTRIGISHFLPSWDTVDPKWMHPTYKDMNHYFVSEIESETLAKFDYWLFGHTHDATAVTKYGCKMIANPRGYPNENQIVWKPKMLDIAI